MYLPSKSWLKSSFSWHLIARLLQSQAWVLDTLNTSVAAQSKLFLPAIIRIMRDLEKLDTSTQPRPLWLLAMRRGERQLATAWRRLGRKTSNMLEKRKIFHNFDGKNILVVVGWWAILSGKMIRSVTRFTATRCTMSGVTTRETSLTHCLPATSHFMSIVHQIT